MYILVIVHIQSNGTRDRARTCDLRLRRALLFQLSYSCIYTLHVFNEKDLITRSWQLLTLAHLRDALPSARVGLTSVFGMGTGVPQPL